ncbi:DNA methyltransferase [Methylomonas methanica]|uniref:DNA (cytosine-5-)-methyltransferase n=1 Tax=Methylomonas methanica TaxID=421 RepID=A0A177LVE7_METMH|nr:DNA cytosine methyltransferase [Methylomonas methanica]OAH97330.1 DNA methyltransferase [Methylomonas methanica]
MDAIDLFAGAGGFSLGAQMAGVHVVWAANHWPLAVDTHSLNHPGTIHSCQDLQQADWRDVPNHDVLLASPACQGHSLARGKEKPHHDALRSTAWAVVACAEYHRSAVILVENVPEFSRWVLFRPWCDAMQRLGYAVAPHVADAADHGVPQHRERLFLVCTRSQYPLHLELPKQAHVPIANVIEWDAHPWSAINKPGRSEKTLKRVQAGRAAFGDRFVAPYYSSGSGLTGRSIHRPIGTITTKDRWAVVRGDSMRMLQVPEAKAAMGFPAAYRLPALQKDALCMLGNAVCPPVSADFLTAIRQAA